MCYYRSMIVIALTFILFMYIYRVRPSCTGWANGLKGSQLINDGKHCTVPIPDMCEYGIRNNILDFNRWGDTCDKTTNTFDITQVKTSRDLDHVTKVGFPRTEDRAAYYGTSNIAYREWIRDNIIDMGDPKVSQETKDNIESTIDVSNPDNPILSTQIKPDQVRSEEQRLLRERVVQQEKIQGTYGSRIDKDVLILYIDNISRTHIYRQLPETIKFLESLYKNDDADASAYQFFRYHSSYFNTLRSNNGLWYGQVDTVDDTSSDVFDSFTQNGYMTGFFKDACENHANIFDEEDLALHKWDHRGGSFTCDSNYTPLEDVPSLALSGGKDSIFRR